MSFFGIHKLIHLKYKKLKRYMLYYADVKVRLCLSV
jgi:hypothetical protein